MTFHLLRPEWLWAMVPALLLWAGLWRCRHHSGSWRSVIAPELLPYLLGEKAQARRYNLTPALLLCWALAVLAAAGPSFHKIPQPVHQHQDALVMVLDLSFSMTAGDLAPSRTDRARQKLLDLLAQRREGQTGLIAYAGDAHIVTPLTDDTPTIANLLPALNPGMMPVPGSQPAAAVEQALGLLKSAGIRQGQILLVTDGISDNDSRGVVDALRGSGASLSIMGVGTGTGAPLPLPRGGFLKDDSGAIVVPALEEAPLRALAAATGGRYMRMQVDDSDLAYLLAQNEPGLDTPLLAMDRSADTWEDQGYLLVVLLLPVVLVLFRRGWLVCLLPLIVLPLPQKAEAGLWDDLWLTPDQQGQRALQQENNEAAAQLFEDSAWAGTAAYRAGDYERAAQRFAEDDSADAWYNRGNALARSGQLEQAIEAYKASLARDPDRQDARQNLDLLEQLKQQQDQQNQQGEDGEQQQGQEGEQSQEQQQGRDKDEPQQSGDAGAGDPSAQQDNADPGSDQDSTGEQAQNRDGAAEESEKEQPETQGAPSQQQASPDETGEDSPEQSAAASAQQADTEKDQAMEQWLRRVPDDPSGLLRQKFRYQSQQRELEGKTQDDDTNW